MEEENVIEKPAASWERLSFNIDLTPSDCADLC